MVNNDNATATAELRAAEQSIEAHSAVFKKELGLTDLVLTQILFVIGLSWVGAAAKLGPSHITFWLLAILLFYIPSAVVVIYLNRLMPLEGGLYQWAKLGFNEFTGFMVAWNLWIYVIVLTSEIGLQVATYLSYALGPNAAWLAGSKWVIAGASFVIIGALVVVSTIGLGVGKWIHNAGAVMMIVIFAALIALPILNWSRGAITEYRPLAVAAPALSLFSLNILGKLGFGALGGFEYMAILAGECRDPVRTINRSVIIAAPIIAVMFILGTSSVLAVGAPTGKSGWPVAVRHPLTPDAAPVAHVELADRSLSCSAARHPGQRQSDVVNPLTGRLLDGDAACVTLAANATDAEIFSTALLAMGREEVKRYLERAPRPGLVAGWFEPEVGFTWI